jgi:hypothetical protein
VLAQWSGGGCGWSCYRAALGWHGAYRHNGQAERPLDQDGHKRRTLTDVGAGAQPWMDHARSVALWQSRGGARRRLRPAREE